MTDIAVSVVMPSYNDGAWLRRAVDSVLTQAAAVPGLELLLVDDASTDAATRAEQEALAELARVGRHARAGARDPRRPPGPAARKDAHRHLFRRLGAARGAQAALHEWHVLHVLVDHGAHHDSCCVMHWPTGAMGLARGTCRASPPPSRRSRTG